MPWFVLVALKFMNMNDLAHNAGWCWLQVIARTLAPAADPCGHSAVSAALITRGLHLETEHHNKKLFIYVKIIFKSLKLSLELYFSQAISYFIKSSQ